MSAKSNSEKSCQYDQSAWCPAPNNLLKMLLCTVPFHQGGSRGWDPNSVSIMLWSWFWHWHRAVNIYIRSIYGGECPVRLVNMLSIVQACLHTFVLWITGVYHSIRPSKAFTMYWEYSDYQGWKMYVSCITEVMKAW